MTLSAGELGRRSGISEERVEELVSLGILQPGEAGFRASDVQRVRVTEALEEAGVPAEDLGRLIDGGWFSFEAADVLFPDPVPLGSETLEEATKALGIPLSLGERALTAWAVPPPEPGERIRADDRSILEVVAAVYEVLGRDENRTIAGIRYFGDNLRRIAESQMQWFRSQVFAPAFAAGPTQAELTPMIIDTAGRLLPLAREALALGYRRHIEHYSVEVTVENIETALERAGLGPAHRRHETVIAFVDLTGYTSLTETEGDVAASNVAERLIEHVRAKATECGGRAVKFLGDGAMLNFADPAQAVRCGLDLIEAIPGLGLPNAHIGMSSGPVVFSDGDYFGRTVNVAARIADRAGPNELLLAEGALAPVPDDLMLTPLGPVKLKGLADPVNVYRADWA